MVGSDTDAAFLLPDVPMRPASTLLMRRSRHHRCGSHNRVGFDSSLRLRHEKQQGAVVRSESFAGEPRHVGCGDGLISLHLLVGQVGIAKVRRKS